MPATRPYRPQSRRLPLNLFLEIRAIRAIRGNPVQPLKGLPGTRATDVSYRALAPGGAGFCYRICTGTSEFRLTAHYSLLTANSSYTFSAKERDSETGLSYFGSRYYSSDLSVWLSVDPMSDKYPSTSPYAYCRNNPIILVDDNGNKDRPFNPEKDQGQTILQNINTPFSYVFDSKGREIGYSISNYFTCYNCHSYAWNNSLGSKYSKAVNYLGLALSGGGAPFGIDFIQNYAYVLPRWNNDPTNDILEQGARQMLNTENNQVGDRVIYYYDENGSEKYEPGEPIVHSAIVEEVDVNGYTTLVKAKCGEGPITVNHPDAPNYYSIYKDPAGESHKTRRAYFRIPATNNQQEP